jgi:two-component system NtrC family sensor kinase
VPCGLAELRQVFLNLMKNAVDAMRARGGTLTLSTSAEAAVVVVRIGDTGPGLTASEAGRIFEPFYTTKAAGEGTGLGLPISLWIVERLGGRIEVEAGEGAGATFAVVLPAGERGGSAVMKEVESP